MSWPRHETTRLALVVLLALTARLAFVGWWQQTHVREPQQFEFPDSASYWELGHDIAAGEPYQVGSPDRRVHRTPGYPLLLAAMFRVVGQEASPTWARGLGAALGALTVGAVYWLARQIFGLRVAWLAAAIVALYPEAIVVSVLPLSDGPFCLWMVLQLAVWRWAAHRSDSTSYAIAVCAGAIGGMATLTRPSWLLFTPLFVALWTLASRFDHRQTRRQLALGGTMLAALAIAMTPWWIHNYRVVGRFVPTTLWVGPSLYDGLSPTADGRSDMSFVPAFEAKLRAADAANPPIASDPPFEYRFDRLLRDAALRWAAANPVNTLELAGTKLLRMWNIWPNEPQFRSWFVRLAVFGTYTPILLLSLYGAWRFRDRGLDVLLLILPAVYFSLLHAVFIGSLRYRQPAMLTLAILAAAVLISLLDRFQQRTSPPANPAAR
ncbi:MAG: glycosyltransferase family 39 protein [Pirellulales bacterium]